MNEVREAIGNALYGISAYDLEQVCDALKMPPQPEGGADPFASKRSYVNRRLIGCSLEDLISFVGRIADEYGDEGLEKYLTGFGVTGVDGELKNLIFAADGPKPRIVLRDAVNNVIEIVENADHCLVYDRPLGPEGLTWQALVDWWRDQYEPNAANDLEAGRRLHLRLQSSLQSPPEELVLKTYAERYGQERGFDLPALVPQVYLHYDPYTKAELGPEGEVLARQRMDYLMLLPDQSRVVIEVDGRQHYSSGDKDQFSDPGRYAEMVREDRALRLRGYEVYRFGGAEFAENDAAERVNEFFEALLSRHDLQV
jgi:very-short-patch-repair endonuclease